MAAPVQESQRSIRKGLSDKGVSYIDLEKSLGGTSGLQRFFDLGSPRLRTAWEIQSFSVSFSSEMFAPSEILRHEVPVEFIIFAGSNPLDYTIIKLVQNIGEEPPIVVPKKQYVLEMFAPVVVSKAQALGLQVKWSLDPAGVTQAKLLEPEAIVIFNQKFPV